MHILQAILMGIVQGLSEFLPISSSAHLVFTSNLYKIFSDTTISNTSQEVFFDIMAHVGTLIAVIIFFRKDLLKIIKAFNQALTSGKWKDNDALLGYYIIIGTIITVLIAVPLNNFSAHMIDRPELVGIFLIITSAVLFVSENLAKNKKDTNDKINFKTSVVIGIAQGLASIPGFSRSGWTIAAGLWKGLDRVAAARYSFLLSIPIIMGASVVYPIAKIDFSEMIIYNWTAIIIGTIVSGIVGYFCIKYFMKFLSKFSMNIFAWYCLCVGILATIFFMLN